MKELVLLSGQFSNFPKLAENAILGMIGTITCFRTLCEFDTLALHCFPDKTQDCNVEGTTHSAFQDQPPPM